MTLSVSRLCGVGDRMIIECGAVGGKRTDKGSRSTRRKPAYKHTTYTNNIYYGFLFVMYLIPTSKIFKYRKMLEIKF
jgi:hypothetical protein